jgi:hypothetical protein
MFDVDTSSSTMAVVVAAMLPSGLAVRRDVSRRSRPMSVEGA